MHKGVDCCTPIMRSIFVTHARTGVYVGGNELTVENVTDGAIIILR